MTGGRQIRINLGAGLQEAPGWINYDRSRAALLAQWPLAHRMASVAARLGLISRGSILRWPRATRVHDLTKGIPHPDNTVDVVYSSHFLEHLTPAQADALMREAYRVLRPGGLIRIVVPDLEVAVDAYQRGDASFFHHPDRPPADAFMSTFYEHDARPPRLVERMVRQVLRSDDGGHKWMYDARSLAALLERAGFQQIERVSRGAGRHPEVAELDLRSAHGLHVEATKPV